MVGLIDVAPLTEEVPIGAQSVGVVGVSARGVAVLLARFPDLQTIFSGQDIPVAKLFDFGAEAISAIIAAGCGTPGDTKAEEVAASLPIEDQANLLEAIIRLTLPGGLGPFVERLSKIGQVLGVGDQGGSTKAPDTSSPAPSSD